MHIHGLGPHTTFNPEPHARHHAWLTQFSPRQRHELIHEDEVARWQAAGILFSAIGSGLVLGIIVVLLTAL